MGKLYTEITPELAAWILRQRMFFVATAPSDSSGHVNCSPKGLDALRVLDPHRVAYLDLTGSGSETVAHVRENGRIVIMLCAFDGSPRIVRLHGTGQVVTPTSRKWNQLRPQFPDLPGERAIITVATTRISESCGFGVPRFDFQHDRETLSELARSKGPAQLAEYRQQKNAQSIDGLKVLDDRCDLDA